MSSRPEDHPRILEEEKVYIMSNIYDEESKTHNTPDGKLPVPPYKHILLSVPTVATVVTTMCHHYGFYTLLTMTPTYLNNIQHFSLDSNGFVSALPYLSLICFSIPWSRLADWIIASEKFSRTNVRKISTAVSLTVPAIALCLLAFANCDHTLPVIYMCIAVGVDGAGGSGHRVAIIELSPNYAGLIYAIVNSSGNVMGIIAPMVVGALVDGNQTFGGWRTVYLIAMAINIFGAIVFTIFGSANAQPWDTYWLNPEMQGINSSNKSKLNTSPTDGRE